MILSMPTVWMDCMIQKKVLYLHGWVSSTALSQAKRKSKMILSTTAKKI